MQIHQEWVVVVYYFYYYMYVFIRSLITRMTYNVFQTGSLESERMCYLNEIAGVKKDYSRKNRTLDPSS